MIGLGSITDAIAFPGTISCQDGVAVVINAASTAKNSFFINDTAGMGALTLNTGTANGNAVLVDGTSYSNTLNINNQGAGSTTKVLTTAALSETYINDSASDAITLGNITGVEAIQGDVSISSGTPDSDTLDVNDQGDGVLHQGSRSVTVTNRSIVGLARGTISYDPYTLSSLTLEADSRGTIWNVQGTPIPYSYLKSVGTNGGVYEFVTLPITTSIICAGQDTVNLGDPSNGLQDIAGTLNIYSPGASAALQVNLDDHETTYLVPCSVNITTTSITGNSVGGLGQVVINYGILNLHGNVIAGGVSELTVRAGTGGTTFTVGDMTGGPATVNLSAMGTGNSLVGPNSEVQWTFQGHISYPLGSFTQGSNASTVYFAGIGAITGGSAANDFQFIQTGFAGSIDGGSSGDSTLDFRRYGGSSLSVELTQDGSLNGEQGTATEGTSFDNIDRVLGDAAADWGLTIDTIQNGVFQGDFTHCLTVAGFANMQVNIAGDFTGELLASTEGTAANPISQFNVTHTIEAGARIKVGFLLDLDVEGDMDGIVKAFGDDPSVPTIQTLSSTARWARGPRSWPGPSGRSTYSMMSRASSAKPLRPGIFRA